MRLPSFASTIAHYLSRNKPHSGHPLKICARKSEAFLPSTCPTSNCQAPLNAEKDGAPGGEGEEEKDETVTGDASNPEQLALLEVWMGFPGYGTTRGQAAGGEEAGAAIAKLRRALNLHEDVTASSEGGNADEGSGAIAPTSTLEVHPIESVAPLSPPPGMVVFSRG